MDELGKLQDNVMEYVEDGTKEFENEESWYDNYDTKVNMAIREAKEYMDRQYTPPVRMFHGDMAHMAKLKKLEIPTFRSEHREYFIWKKMFERYTEQLDDITKYDYLFTYTDGESNTLIKGKETYDSAIQILDREYGNKNYTMKLLIDDIRRLSIVRKGGYKAFENLSREVNGFRRRLHLMGKEDEVENT